MSGNSGNRGNLERRYRWVLRLMPGYYRAQWEEDMITAFLDGWLTGDPETDEYISRVAWPGWAEVTSVIGLAARLYLGGAGTPRRYFAWGQAVRRAVLAAVLMHAVLGLDVLVQTAWNRRLFGLPAPPAILWAASPGGVWFTVFYGVNVVWIVIFVALVLGHYRTARVLAVLAVVPGLVASLQAQLTGSMPAPFASWAFWVPLTLVPVLAMAAFHADAPPAARWPWLLALPAGELLVVVPLLALQATGNFAWVPDFPGVCCLLAALACLAHAPRAWSRRAAGPGGWSLALVLLAAVAAVYRIASLTVYLHDDPHLIAVGLGELLILGTAAALIAPDAARAQAATPPPPPVPHPIAA